MSCSTSDLISSHVLPGLGPENLKKHAEEAFHLRDHPQSRLDGDLGRIVPINRAPVSRVLDSWHILLMPEGFHLGCSAIFFLSLLVQWLLRRPYGTRARASLIGFHTLFDSPPGRIPATSCVTSARQLGVIS